MKQLSSPQGRNAAYNVRPCGGRHAKMNVPAVCSPGIYKERFPLPPGFTNKHNCCYANSIIQCVMNISPLSSLCRCLDATHNTCTECKIEGIDISVQSRVYIMPPPSQDIRLYFVKLRGNLYAFIVHLNQSYFMHLNKGVGFKIPPIKTKHANLFSA